MSRVKSGKEEARGKNIRHARALNGNVQPLQRDQGSLVRILWAAPEDADASWGIPANP